MSDVRYNCLLFDYQMGHHDAAAKTHRPGALVLVNRLIAQMILVITLISNQLAADS